jgi:hypothetical protein
MFRVTFRTSLTAPPTVTVGSTHEVQRMFPEMDIHHLFKNFSLVEIVLAKDRCHTEFIKIEKLEEDANA